MRDREVHSVRASAEIACSADLTDGRVLDVIIRVSPLDEISVRVQIEKMAQAPREVANLVIYGYEDADRAARAIAEAFDKVRDLRRFVVDNTDPGWLPNDERSTETLAEHDVGAGEPMTGRPIDPDVQRCIANLPEATWPTLTHLLQTLRPDDTEPIVRAAREGVLDDHDVSFLLGRLYERACREALR